MIKYLLTFLFYNLAIILPSTGAENIPGLTNKNLIREGMPEEASAYQETSRGYIRYSSNNFLSWKDDKRLIISKSVKGKSQLHLLNGRQGKAKQITFFKSKGVGSAVPVHLSGKDGFLVGRDQNGNEYHQYYFIDRLTRHIIKLTDQKYRYSSYEVSKDKNYILFSRSLGTSNRKSLSLLDLTQSEAGEKTLLETGKSLIPLDWSADGNTVLILDYVSTTENYLALLNITTGELDYITPQDQNWAFPDARFTKDGAGLFIASNVGSDVVNLRYMNLKTRKIYYVAREINWPVVDLDLSPDGKTLAIVSNENGLNRIYFLNTDTYKLHDPKGTQMLGIISKLTFSPNSSKVAMNLSHPLLPRNVFVYDLKQKKLKKWAENRNTPIKNPKLSMPQLIYYPTFDKDYGGRQRTIPAWVYRPREENKKFKKSPVIISLHGGPASQQRLSLNTTYQYLANHMGIAIIAPNVRGSKGYGRNYINLDNGYKREDSVKDVGALLDWIKANPDLDEDRVMVMGGSYGGYMVLASLVHYSDRLKAGIDRVGISNFTTFLENTSEYRVDSRRSEYGDERNPEMRAFHAKISPLNNAAKIKKPLFVIQGKNDPRVPASEARQIVNAVKANGIPVWYLLATNEGHGFKKNKNRRFLTRSTIAFINKYLLDHVDLDTPAIRGEGR